MRLKPSFIDPSSAAGFCSNLMTSCNKWFGPTKRSSSSTRDRTLRMMVPTWSSENPHKILEVNNRNGKKMTIFVATVDGHIPIVHAFMGEDGKSQSVNGDRSTINPQARRECCEESQTVCRRKWWSFSTPYLIGSKTCHLIFIKDCYE